MKYRETFNYATTQDVDLECATIRTVVEQHGLELEQVTTTPADEGRTLIELTVVGSSRDINNVRAIVAEDIDASAGNSGGDLADLAIMIAMSAAARPARRAWWSFRRRTRGPIDSAPDG